MAATDVDVAGGGGHGGASPAHGTQYWVEVGRQARALLQKNFKMLRRKKLATVVRVATSVLVVLLICLINGAWMSILSASDTSVKDLPRPVRQVVHGLPSCGDACLVFGYAPAPLDEYHPDMDLSALAKFVLQFPDACPSTCTDADCAAAQPGPSCSKCCELHRTHKVVRGIIRNNGTGASGEGARFPIPSTKVLGFKNDTGLTEFMWNNPVTVRGNYIFASPNAKTMTFVVQQNTSDAYYKRKVFRNSFMTTTIPMQVAAEREIARQVYLQDETIEFEVSTAEFPHPQRQSSSLEALITPQWIPFCFIVPMAIQIMEIVADKEKKLRQSMAAMGLHDLSYWLALHVYYTAIAFLQGLSLTVIGYIFQLKMFAEHDFLAVLLTFWMAFQAFTGVGFFFSGCATQTATAFKFAMGAYFLGDSGVRGLIEEGFPYGQYKTTAPFSLSMNQTTGNYTLSSDNAWVEPVFSFWPMSLVYKNIMDLNDLAAPQDSKGLRLGDANSYCAKEDLCFWHFSLASSWGIYLLHYVVFSLLGIYMDNICPDALGAKKPPFYFLVPSYWGFGIATVEDKVEKIKGKDGEILNESTDKDVLEEERVSQERMKEQTTSSEFVIDVRGLQQRFERKEKGPGDWFPKKKEFYAVKAPWYGIGRNQLFALLGPNGAGKSTTINMLTGFLPATKGNALILGNTIMHDSGMAQIRRRMGVCPQFDTLWDGLTAREHLNLFGAIKGLPADTVPIETDRLLEEVRLTEAADVVASNFSGGMRRRLSVAIALIGDPAVVFLDEPTTGMDPINRRHVWDLIEKAKQDRTIVLTTHSMEEADILGDRVGIMAKGRLRCIGSSLHLKNHYGKGFRISVSIREQVGAALETRRAVAKIFQDWFKVQPEEAISSYLVFNVPGADETVLSQFFAEIEQHKSELGIVDIQVSLSSLEDVFLTIAKDSEKEDAEKRGQKEKVVLLSGETVEVVVGNEDEVTSKKGVTFRVTWTADESGKLIVAEILENPTGSVVLDNESAAPQAAQTETSARKTIKPTPAPKQVAALLKKSLRYQATQPMYNCCLVMCPLISVGLFMLIAFLLFTLFLAMPWFKCPYCGPEDSFALTYCNGKNCSDYFFEDAGFNRQECIETSQTCGGKESFECFKPDLASGFQRSFCPSKTAPESPVLRYATPDTFRAADPVLYTSTEDAQFASSIADQLYSNGTDESAAQMAGTQRALIDIMYHLLTALPGLSCREELAEEAQLAALCKLMQLGTGSDDVCCADLSNSSLTDDGVDPMRNVNFWTDIREYNESRWMREVSALGNDQAARWSVKTQWESQGVRFGQGMAVTRAKLLGLAAEVWPAFASQDISILPNEGSMRCVRPQFSAAAAEAVGEMCTGLEEGVALLAHALGMPATVIPQVEPHTVARWAKSCDTMDSLQDLQWNSSITWGALQERLKEIPCLCRWISFVKRIAAPLAIPAATWFGPASLNLPHAYNCPKQGNMYVCAPSGFGGSVMHLWSMPGIKVATSHFPQDPIFGQDSVLRAAEGHWWNEGYDEDRGQWGDEPSGLKWKEVGAEKPTWALREIASAELAAALASKTKLGNKVEFTEKEWVDFGVRELRDTDVIKSGDSYFTVDCVGCRVKGDLSDKEYNESAWEREAGPAGWGVSGKLSVLLDDCAALAGGLCFFNKMANLTGRELKCIDAKPTAVPSLADMQSTIYKGVWAPYADTPVQIQERITGYDFANSNRGRFNMTLLYNKTLGGKTFMEIVNAAVFPDRRQERIAAPISDAMSAFVNARKKTNFDFHGSLKGLREMPRKRHGEFTIDLSSTIGSFSCVMTIHIVCPMIVEAVMHEKEHRIRIMMRMMGLSSSVYWAVTWLFWSGLYLLFLGVFNLWTVVFELPNGYSIGWFADNEASVVFVFFVLVSQHMIATAFLISAVWGSYRGSTIHASKYFVFFVCCILLTTICQMLVDQGGQWMGASLPSPAIRNLWTIIPFFTTYRGVLELLEYSYQATYQGTGGLNWSKIGDPDEECGMAAVFTTLALEAVVFQMLTHYLDQIVDTGFGVPQHPLFFLGFKRSADPVATDDEEVRVGSAAAPPDVLQERARVNGLVAAATQSADEDQLPVVMIQDLKKIYPAQDGNPPKVACKSLTLGVNSGECFGMLGPNGAGKTTSISCLIGMIQPSAGNALVAGLSIREDMDKIYSTMGICPQHDILWERLTARAHMQFYGALKNLTGKELEQAVLNGLRMVQLLNWIDQKVSTFSGGMKRRLSVAISMIGSPSVTYLDEPSTGLDPASRRSLWACVKEAKKSRAIFLTTHSMEEAEELCDRVGIFVDGSLRCIDSPKALSARFGGYYVLTVTTLSTDTLQAVCCKVQEMCQGVARATYALGTTQRFEVATSKLTLSQVFLTMGQCKQALGITDWGIANATLEETFIRICNNAQNASLASNHVGGTDGEIGHVVSVANLEREAV